MTDSNTWPKLHNAMWPGLVGKGAERRPADRPGDDARPDRRRRGGRRRASTASISSCSIRTSASTPTTTRSSGWPSKVRSRGLVVGSVVAPVWPPTGGGSAMGSDEDASALRRRRCDKACRIAGSLRELGVRPYGVVRIDSAAAGRRLGGGPGGRTRGMIAETFRQACDVAESHGERLAAEGEICWGGMHSWRRDGRAAGSGGPPADARLPGRHGAHAALHARRQRARGPHPARRLRLGATREVLDDALQDADRRAAALDDRFPRRPERRHGQGLRLARQDRAATACRTTRTASSTSSAHAGFWLRDETGEPTARLPAHLLGRLHVPQRAR